MLENSTRSRRGAAGGGLLIALLLGVGLLLFLNFGPTGSDGSSAAERAIETKHMAEELHDNIDLYAWQQMVVTYYLSNNQMPESIDDIPEMRALKDRWDTEYRYEVIDERQKTFRITSAGIDLIFDTEDDIVAEGKANI
ncbi:MAG: hypothetical protein AAGI30_14570 [Planctomycetota bacterium]